MEACWSFLVQSTHDLRGPYCTSCVNKRHRFKIEQLHRRNDLVLFIHLVDKSEKLDYWKLQLENGSLTPFTIADKTLVTKLAALSCVDSNCDADTVVKPRHQFGNKQLEFKEKYTQTTVKSTNQYTETTAKKCINQAVQTTVFKSTSLPPEPTESVPIETVPSSAKPAGSSEESVHLPDAKRATQIQIEMPPFYTRSKNVVHPLNLTGTVITRLTALGSQKFLAATSAKLREKYPEFAQEIQKAHGQKTCPECKSKFSGFEPSVQHVFSVKHLHLVNRDGNGYDQADFNLIMNLCNIPIGPIDFAEKVKNSQTVAELRAPFHMPRSRDDVTLTSPMQFDEKQRVTLAKMFGEPQTFTELAKAYEEKYGKMIAEYQWKICRLCTTQTCNVYSHIQHILSIRHFNQAVNKKMTFDESEMMSVKKLLFSVQQEIQRKSQPKNIGTASTSSSTKDLPSTIVNSASVSTIEKTTVKSSLPAKESNNSSSSISKKENKKSLAAQTVKPKPNTTSGTVQKKNGDSDRSSTGTFTVELSCKGENGGPKAMNLTEKQLRALTNIPLMYGTTHPPDSINEEELQKHINLIGHELIKFSAETDFERLRDVFELRGWKASKCVFCVNDLDGDYLCHVIKPSHRKNMNDKGIYHWKKDYQSILRIMVQTYGAIEEANRLPLPFLNGTRDPTKKLDDQFLMSNLRCFRLKLKEYMPESIEGILEEQYRRVDCCGMCKVSLTSRNRLDHFISEEHISLLLAKDRYFSKWDVYLMNEIISKLALEDTKLRYRRLTSSQPELGADALAWTVEQPNNPVVALHSLSGGAQLQKLDASVAERNSVPVSKLQSTTPYRNSTQTTGESASHSTRSTENAVQTPDRATAVIKPTPNPAASSLVQSNSLPTTVETIPKIATSTSNPVYNQQLCTSSIPTRASVNSSMNGARRSSMETRSSRPTERTPSSKSKDSCTIS